MKRLPFEVFVVVRRGEEYLVTHRVPDGGAYWHCVAGALEEGETYAQAAKRELYEETGLAADPYEIGEPFVYSLDDEPAGIAVRCFLVEAPPGWEPALNFEHDEYRWCTREQAIELLYWPEPKDVIRAL
jgi:8-oxo-dGTP pyrophosphatase MutT (NUDIX family)